MEKILIIFLIMLNMGYLCKFFCLPITPDCVGVMTNKLYWHILRRTGLLLGTRKYQNRVVEILVLSEPAGKTRFCPVLYVKRRLESNETCFTSVAGTYITKKYLFLKIFGKICIFFIFPSITRVCVDRF